MCWPHVHQNLESHFKHLRSANKEIASKLKKDIEELQWTTVSKESFLYRAKVLEQKYQDCRFDSITKTSCLNRAGTFSLWLGVRYPRIRRIPDPDSYTRVYCQAPIWLWDLGCQARLSGLTRSRSTWLNSQR